MYVNTGLLALGTAQGSKSFNLVIKTYGSAIPAQKFKTVLVLFVELCSVKAFQNFGNTDALNITSNISVEYHKYYIS